METFSALVALCEFPHKGQWRGALLFSLICDWTNDWTNNRYADFRRHRPHYDLAVMYVFVTLWFECHFNLQIRKVRHGNGETKMWWTRPLYCTYSVGHCSLFLRHYYIHDDVIKWKHFPRYWPFVRGMSGEFPAQRPVTWSVGVFFDLRLNKLLNKQSWGWWFETLS